MLSKSMVVEEEEGLVDEGGEKLSFVQMLNRNPFISSGCIKPMIHGLKSEVVRVKS
jgi:hypothetical protein